MECILSATVTGWVAVGWHTNTGSPDGKANGFNTNILIGYVTGGSNAFMSDDYNDNGNGHTSDTSGAGVNNITNLTGTEAGGVTELRFTYPLNSGDARDIPLVSGNFYNFIMARHGTADDFTNSHTGTTAWRNVIQNTMF